MFSIGSDPEFMLTKDGQYYSAIGVIKGDIAERIQIEGHQFYWDNVMAECAIKPANSLDETLANFRQCFQLYAELALPYRLTVQAFQEYPAEQLEHHYARMAGCAPDWCAYTIKKKKPPKGIIENTNFRTCGGHLHIGAEILNPDHWQSIVGVRLLDLFMGIPALFLDADPTSTKRRKVYGQAGRYRPKPYGLEYRSLGNFWLSSPKFVEIIYDLTEFFVGFMNDKRYEEFYTFNEELYYKSTVSKLKNAFTCYMHDEADLRRCLDKNDKKKGRAYLKIALAIVPKELSAKITDLIDNPRQYDMYQEWGIKQ